MTPAPGALSHPVVLRPALHERLELGVAGPVTLVAAPAGSGKTLLVRSWLAGRDPAPGAWLSVERGERDGQRFWRGLLSALAGAAPSGLPIQVPEPSPEFDGDALVRRLLSQLTVLQSPVVLVVDDLHELRAPEALEQFRYLLDHLPGSVHVVLITRRDPQLGLHRHRLAGELTELRSADLRFTPAETRDLLAGAGIVLSDEGLERLHERTEGWAAGVRLAALTLSTHADPERFVADFSGSERTVAEYLLAEVLDAQSARVRRLLVRTALLERVNGPLADLLTGGSGAEDDLRALCDAGGFVVALDEGRTWFRFHHLFADLLALELRHAEPEEVARLHLLAAGWYAEHDQFVEAIHHAGLAGAREQAAGLLIEHYVGLALDGRQATARALLEEFAPVRSAVLAPEILAVIAADELVAGSLDQAEAFLALAGRQAPLVPEAHRSRFASSLLATRLSLARRRGDFRSVLAELQPAGVVEVPQSGRDVARHNDVRAMTLLSLGIVEVWSGRIDEGTRHLAEAGELARQIGRPYLQVECRAHAAYAIAWRSFTRARAASQEAITLAEQQGWGGDAVIGPALATMGGTLVHAGRLDEAELLLARAGQTMRPDLEPAMGVLLHVAYGTLHAARQQDEAAIASYRAADRLGLLLINGSPLSLQLRCSLLIAMIGVGQTSAVAAALADLPAAERSSGEAREVVAVLALAQADPAAATAVLAPSLDGSAPVHHPLVVVRSLLLDALARDALGQSGAAETAVERALDLAEGDALVSPFLHVRCRSLLERHPRHRTAHGAFVAEVLDVLSGSSPTPAQPHHAVAEPLSDAEFRVLRFLPTNLPTSAIAGEMYVSVNTVKTHMRHIYAKLDAHSRVGAVTSARRLGLLGHSGRQP